MNDETIKSLNRSNINRNSESLLFNKLILRNPDANPDILNSIVFLKKYPSIDGVYYQERLVHKNNHEMFESGYLERMHNHGPYYIDIELPISSDIIDSLEIYSEHCYINRVFIVVDEHYLSNINRNIEIPMFDLGMHLCKLRVFLHRIPEKDDEIVIMYNSILIQPNLRKQLQSNMNGDLFIKQLSYKH